MKRITTFSLCLLALALLVPVQAQELDDLSWGSVDNGGEFSGGSIYTLQGAIGQPDAGRMTGSTYTLNGGFWPGLVGLGDVPVVKYTIYLPLILR